MLHRLTIFVVDIFFPPLAVLLLAGCGPDLAVSCCLFILGVIPSHIHAFYISCTYFNRRRKVKRDKWPGQRRGGIFSDNVQNGGYTNAAMKRMEWQNASRREKLQDRRSYSRV
jgi:uncharacterized membrane protein YqaE (UPF0057 family)